MTDTTSELLFILPLAMGRQMEKHVSLHLKIGIEKLQADNLSKCISYSRIGREKQSIA